MRGFTLKPERKTEKKKTKKRNKIHINCLDWIVAFKFCFVSFSSVITLFVTNIIIHNFIYLFTILVFIQ